MQAVIITPVLDVVFLDKVEGADELHALKIGAVELGHHGLNLCPVEHTHEYGFNDIIVVVA